MEKAFSVSNALISPNGQLIYALDDYTPHRTDNFFRYVLSLKKGHYYILVFNSLESGWIDVI